MYSPEKSVVSDTQVVSTMDQSLASLANSSDPLPAASLQKNQSTTEDTNSALTKAKTQQSSRPVTADSATGLEQAIMLSRDGSTIIHVGKSVSSSGPDKAILPKQDTISPNHNAAKESQSLLLCKKAAKDATVNASDAILAEHDNLVNLNKTQIRCSDALETSTNVNSELVMKAFSSEISP